MSSLKFNVQHRGLTDFEKMVFKATSSKVEPPKRKHVRSIVIECHQQNGAGAFFEALMQRPLDTNEVVCLKCLETIHKLCQEGPPAVIRDCVQKVSFIQSLGKAWAHVLEKGYSAPIRGYADFLGTKLLFHRQFPQFNGVFGVEEYVASSGGIFNAEQSLQMVTAFLDLQEEAFKLYKTVRTAPNLNECKISSFVALVTETYGIYSVVVFLLTKLVQELEDMEVFNFLVERFYASYIQLRGFYYEVGSMRSVSSVIMVPSLPVDPPTFTVPKKPKLKKRVSVKKKVAPSEEHKTPLVFTQIETEAPAPRPIIVEPKKPITQAIPAVASKPSSWVTFPTSNSIRISESKSDTHLLNREEVKEEEQEEEEPKDSDELIALRKRVLQLEKQLTLAKQAILDKNELIKKLQSGGQALIQYRDSLLSEKKALNVQVESLEEQLETVQDQSEHERFRRKVEAIAETKDVVSRSLALFSSPTFMGNTAATASEIHSGLDLLNNNVTVLTELAQDVDKDDADLFAALKDVAASNHTLLSDAKGASTQVDNVSSRSLLVDKTRETVAVMLQLLETVRMQGGDTHEADEVQELATDFLLFQNSIPPLKDAANTLETTIEQEKQLQLRLDKENQEKELLLLEEQNQRKEWLYLEEQKIKKAQLLQQEELLKITELRQQEEQRIRNQQILREAEDKKREQQLSEERLLREQQIREADELKSKQDRDIEDLAEKELLEAARTIEEAAKVLLNSKKETPKNSMTPPDVTDAILDAATAITVATSSLVSAAASAQKERKENGLAKGADASLYRDDPMWAEGLVSAAKAVAAAVSQLVRVANSCAQGELEDAEEALIAATKAVGAATAQLVAATTAKSDPQSPTQMRMQQAAKAVSSATGLLVAAAKALLVEEKSDLTDYSKLSVTQFKVKEMEQQMKILKLEKELDQSRKQLFRMREQQYKKR